MTWSGAGVVRCRFATGPCCALAAAPALALLPSSLFAPSALAAFPSALTFARCFSHLRAAAFLRAQRMLQKRPLPTVPSCSIAQRSQRAFSPGASFGSDAFVFADALAEAPKGFAAGLGGAFDAWAGAAAGGWAAESGAGGRGTWATFVGALADEFSAGELRGF